MFSIPSPWICLLAEILLSRCCEQARTYTAGTTMHLQPRERERAKQIGQLQLKASLVLATSAYIVAQLSTCVAM